MSKKMKLVNSSNLSATRKIQHKVIFLNWSTAGLNLCIFFLYLPYWSIGRVFINGSNPRLSYTKDSKKWYLISPCLTLSIIRYVSRVKWSHPRKGVVPSPIPWCSSYWKGSLQVTLDYSLQLAIPKLRSPICPIIYPKLRGWGVKDRLIHAFHKVNNHDDKPHMKPTSTGIDE